MKNILNQNNYTSFNVNIKGLGSYAINLFVGDRLATTVVTESAATTLQVIQELKNHGLTLVDC